MLKRVFSVIVSGGILALAVPAITFATPVSNPAVTYVSGTVTHNGNPVSGASVTVTCNGHVLTDITASTGGYIVKYSPATLCPNGALATASATDGSLKGSGNGSVKKLTTKLNIDVVNVSIVPEMGIVAAVSASVIGAGAFLSVRHRKLNDKS